MVEPLRLTDREFFCARPWRAADRTQVIVAIVQGRHASADPDAITGTLVVLAAPDGRALFSKPVPRERTPGSFTDAELQALYDEASAPGPG